jgi:exopolysaccharide biosynthesis protein
MTLIQKLIAFITLLLIQEAAQAKAYTYEKRTSGQHIMHIVTIDPKAYRAEIVKSNDGAFGRETVASMAKRSEADIAINGGFFEIGGNRDGKATGTLVIKGHEYKVKNQTQALILINEGTISLTQANPKKHLTSKVSIISAIPFLIQNTKIVSSITKKKNTFYTKLHARTALGVRADGTIVIVVVEHQYKRDLSAITAAEIQALMQEKGKILAELYHHKHADEITLSELKEILRKEFAATKGPQGLTIPELAVLMKDLKCKDALNLDGGGSSTLWIEGKVVNRTIGDADEADCAERARLVSDAIIFKID